MLMGRSFTDWCLVHRQQSREQKKNVDGGCSTHIGPSAVLSVPFMLSAGRGVLGGIFTGWSRERFKLHLLFPTNVSSMTANVAPWPFHNLVFVAPVKWLRKYDGAVHLQL